MSPKKLSIIKKCLDESTNLNTEQIDKLTSIIKECEATNYLYPNIIKDSLQISIKEIYKILDELVDIQVLNYAFQLYCHKCEEYIDIKILDSLNEFPEEIYCDNRHKLNASKDSLVIYKLK